MIPVPQRLLIINADDFGYNNAITLGILRGYREGLVTSTTAMINIERAAERIAAAHVEEPGLPIGLHLNLTSGRPVLPPEKVLHLVGTDGCFYPFEAIVPRLPELPIEEVRAEMQAQAAALVDAGIAFDHIDYHQQILAIYTPLFEIAAEIAREYQVPLRQPAVKALQKPNKEVLKSGGREDKLVRFMNNLRSVGGALVRHPLPMLQLMAQTSPTQRSRMAARVGTTDWFFTAFFDNPTLENFTAILDQLPLGTSELMVHPALNAPELYTMPDNYRFERSLELAILIDPHARKAVEQRNIQLANFSCVYESKS